MSWLWGAATNSQYEELVEKACSPLNLTYSQSEDIAVTLEITDLIRSKAVQPKPAMQSLKRRVASRNGRVQMYALALVDTCIKNGGDHFLAEIASKEFVDEMSGVIASPITSAEVKQMTLKLFQQWALAFQSKRELVFLVDVYKELKNSGIAFPPPPSHTSAHLLSTTTAPAWIDSDVCMRCRSAFTFTNRKHHCRNCGLVYDQACSSRQMPLPRFGIAGEVRVCEGCWMKAVKGVNANGPAPVVPGRTPRSREDLDADFQRAIELSLADSQPSSARYVGSEPPLARKAAAAEDDDEEMRLAIEASLRDMEKARPSAPQGADEPEFRPLPTYDLAPRETETILTFSNTLDQMAAYGERDLRRFPHAHILYEQAYTLGAKLQRNAEEKSTKQQMLAEMQDKLSQAVGVYGQILDGQQAYTARKMQEQQQRQYQQQMYAYAPPQQYSQQQYSPYPSQGYAAPAPQMNGHSNHYAAYAPPQQSQPVEQARAGPSLYPSMPKLQAPQQYAPEPAQQFQQHRGEAASPIPPSPYPPQAYDPRQQWAPSQAQPGIEQHSSMRSPSVTAQQSAPQRTASVTYGVIPQVAQSPGHSLEPPQEPMSPAYPSSLSRIQTEGPPPVDMASHPASSPTTSIHSALPSQAAPQSYASPSNLPRQSIPTSPPPAQQNQPYQSAAWQQPAAPPQQYQPSSQQYQPSPQQFQQSPQQRQPSQPVQQPAPQVYSANSFPPAPAAVFPDAPIEAPLGLEKQEREEALLIEL